GACKAPIPRFDSGRCLHFLLMDGDYSLLERAASRRRWAASSLSFSVIDLSRASSSSTLGGDRLVFPVRRGRAAAPPKPSASRRSISATVIRTRFGPHGTVATFPAATARVSVFDLEMPRRRAACDNENVWRRRSCWYVFDHAAK